MTNFPKNPNFRLCATRTILIFEKKKKEKKTMTEFLQDQKVITDSERYDRQIRVWGAEAQSRLQNSKVLICGLQNLNIEVFIQQLPSSSVSKCLFS